MTDREKIILGLQEVRRFILNSSSPNIHELCELLDRAIEVLRRKR